MSTSLDMGPKRSPWVSWVPAVVLSILILVAIVVAVLAASDNNQAPQGPLEGQVTDKNWSIFTDMGIDYIEETRMARIDLSADVVDASEVGLPDDGTVVIGPNELELAYYLTIYGGPGGARITVSEMSFTTEDGAVVLVTARGQYVESFRDTLNALSGRAEVFGWDVSGRDELFEAVGEAIDNNEPYEFSFTGTATGIPVTVTASCEPAGYCITEYEVTPGVG
jgi:hypothetical protein